MNDERAFIPYTEPQPEWPTAAQLVTYMQNLAKEDLEEGVKPELDGLLEMADMLFPTEPENGDWGAFHARAEGILNEAKATVETWLADRTADTK